MHRSTGAAAAQFYAPARSDTRFLPVYHAAPLPVARPVLRVGLNTSALASPRTGIGNYIVHLAAALAARDDVELHAFDGAHWHTGTALPAEGPRAPGRSRLRALVKPFVPFKRELRQLVQRQRFARGARALSLDVYHEPNYVPLPGPLPVVTTVHDLSWIRYPHTHPADRVRWLEAAMPRVIERAAAIVVDSEFTRREVMETFACAADRLHVAHLGVAPEFRPRSREETHGVLGPMGLVHGQYVLSVGTIEPRKNVEHVVEAHARLPPALRARHPLVVAGARGWRAGEIENRLRSLDASRVLRFLGAVDHDALVNLYAGAVAFVFPSFYEGFGLPPLEAMASGVPVLASNRSSVPEVCGDACVPIDPDAPDATSRQLASVLDDPARGAELGRRGVARARAFTWSACADRTVVAYRAALEAAGD